MVHMFAFILSFIALATSSADALEDIPRQGGDEYYQGLFNALKKQKDVTETLPSRKISQITPLTPGESHTAIAGFFVDENKRCTIASAIVALYAQQGNQYPVVYLHLSEESNEVQIHSETNQKEQRDNGLLVVNLPTGMNAEVSKSSRVILRYPDATSVILVLDGDGQEHSVSWNGRKEILSDSGPR